MRRTPSAPLNASYSVRLRRSPPRSRDTCAHTQTAARPALLVPARQLSRQIGLATSHQFQVRRALRKPSPCPVHQGRPFWPRFAAAARAHPVYRGAGLVGEPRTARVARQHRGRRGPVFVLVRNYWVWWVGRYLQNSDSFGLSPSSIGCLSSWFAPERVDHLTRPGRPKFALFCGPLPELHGAAAFSL